MATTTQGDDGISLTAPPTTGGLTLTGGTLTPTSLVPTAAYTQTGNTIGVWGVTVGISGADKLVPTGVAKAASNGTTASEATGWDALSNGAKYGIYGGAAAVGVLIIALITFFCIRKKRKSQNTSFVKRTKSLRESFISSPTSAPLDEKSYGTQGSTGEYPPQQREIRDYRAYARGGQDQYSSQQTAAAAFDQPYR